MLFETEQLENNISRAFLNAIFYPEEKEEYEICLEKNGISQYDRFTVAVISITRDHEIREHFSQRVRSRMDKCMLLEHEQEMICVFYDTKISLIKEQMKMLLRTWHIHYPQAPVRFYLGLETDTYYTLSNSYGKAKICQKIGKRKNQNFLTFDELGVLGILASSEADLMEAHYQTKLKPLIDYDANNDTDYTETLECYIESGCNVSEVAQRLFIHRNTVNYRLRKIREITGDDMTDVGILVDYKIAFLIRCLL